MNIQIVNMDRLDQEAKKEILTHEISNTSIVSLR